MISDRCSCGAFSKIGTNEILQIFDPSMGQYVFHCFDNRTCFYENEYSETVQQKEETT